MIDALFARWTRTQLAQLSGAILRKGVSATWVVGGDAPDFSYGLNRFLSQLIARLHSEVSGRMLETLGDPGNSPTPASEVVVRGYYLNEVYSKASSHLCGDPWQCLNIPHFAVVSNAATPSAGNQKHAIGPFDMIIVRHGVNQTPLFGNAPISEQITPMMPPT